MTNMIHYQLWMGSVESYMTETFIIAAFRKMGENPLHVKIMRNKITGEQAGYCFVHFATDEEAVDAMHKLNSKPIPGTMPIIRFRLNTASNSARALSERDLSVWVGDLSPDVDDYSLYRTFSSKYHTVRTAKVILDNNGFSKGYGFVKFGSEDEMKDCFTTMKGFRGLGTKPLNICSAVHKIKGATPMTGTSSTPSSTDLSQYYDPSVYWQNYASWQTQGYYEQNSESNVAAQQNSAASAATQPVSKEENEYELIDHSPPLDVDKMNMDMIEQDCNFWDAIESSKWLPCEALEVC